MIRNPVSNLKNDWYLPVNEKKCKKNIATVYTEVYNKKILKKNRLVVNKKLFRRYHL